MPRECRARAILRLLHRSSPALKGGDVMSLRQRLRRANSVAAATWNDPKWTDCKPAVKEEPVQEEPVDERFLPIVDQDGIVWRRTLNERPKPDWKA